MDENGGTLSLLDILAEDDDDGQGREERIDHLEMEYETFNMSQSAASPVVRTPTRPPADVLRGRVVDVPFHLSGREPSVPDLMVSVDEALRGQLLTHTQTSDLLHFILASGNRQSCLSEPAWRTRQRRPLAVFEERTKCYVGTRGRREEWQRLLGELTLRRVTRQNAENLASPALATHICNGAYEVWTYELDEAFYVYCLLRSTACDLTYVGHLYAQSIESHQMDIVSSSTSSSSSSSMLASSSSSSSSPSSPGGLSDP